MRLVKLSPVIASVLLLAAGLVQLSCQSTRPPSVLLIAVDDLTVLDVVCNDEDTDSDRSGLKNLCDESVRFTHAFAPSPLVVPTLSSMLTGLYPFQHGVHSNGNPGLAPQWKTVVETALEHNYRTAFFSGGPPVWRKSGLNQGVELFDDNLIPSVQTLYRPLSMTSRSLLQWLRQDVGSSKPFFATVYAPDLIFTNTVTTNEFGEARNLSHESLLDELSENLFTLFTELKETQRWNDTMIIVVGLNGHTSDDRPGELSPTNLHSENTQVALFIKPPREAREARDESLRWKIDRNVSLADIGATLFELLGSPKNPNNPSPMFPLHSFSQIIKKTQPEWSEDRYILMESAWGEWRGMSNRRTSILDSHTLFIYDSPVKIFNTLTDRLELNALRGAELSGPEKQNIFQAFKEANAQPWQGLPPEVLKKYSSSLYRWFRTDQKASLLKDLRAQLNTKTPDPEVLQWAGLLAHQLKNWNGFKAIGIKGEQPFWQFVAERNGALGANVNFSFFSDPCLRLLEIPKIESTDFKKCDDALFLDFIDWQRADVLNLSRDLQRRRFERAYLTALIDQKIREGNLATTLIWDLPKSAPLGPQLTDLVLSLPEYQKIRLSLQRAIQESGSWQAED